MLPHRDVVLLRCAWHKRYFGYPWIYDVISWRGQDLTFSDGMCLRCARRWRASLREIYDESAASATPLVPAWIWRAALAGVVIGVLLLAVRSLNHAGTTAHSSSAKPPVPIAWQIETETRPATVRESEPAREPEPTVNAAGEAAPPHAPDIGTSVRRHAGPATVNHSTREPSSARMPSRERRVVATEHRCCPPPWLPSSISFVTAPGRPMRSVSLQSP